MIRKRIWWAPCPLPRKCSPTGHVVSLWQSKVTVPTCWPNLTLAGWDVEPTYCIGYFLQGPSSLMHVMVYITNRSLHVTGEAIIYSTPVAVALCIYVLIDLGQIAQSPRFPQCLNPGLRFLVSVFWIDLAGSLARIRIKAFCVQIHKPLFQKPICPSTPYLST